MQSLISLTLVFLFSIACSSTQAARIWTSAKGGYKIDAEAIAFNDQTVVLKRKSGKLVAVEVNELSDADRDYLKSKDLSATLNASIEKMQTWTSNSGVKIRGRVLAFGRKDYELTRQRGTLSVNGKLFSRFDPLHQQLLLKVLSALESKTFTTEPELNAWVKETLAGTSKSYTLEGVLMELESGDQIPVPFFLFADEDLRVLEPGWEAWSKANDDETTRERESLMMQAEAREYQQQRESEGYQRQQIEMLKLQMLAARTGLTSIWEVGLDPPPGVYGRRTSVMVTARNSQLASEMVQRQYPGYRIFGIRKAN